MTTNRKRKSEESQIAIHRAGDDEQMQIVALPKKFKTASEHNTPVKKPAPRPRPKQLASTKMAADKAGIPESLATRTPIHQSTKASSRKGDLQTALGQPRGSKLCRTGISISDST
jgi:hypothetical protein